MSDTPAPASINAPTRQRPRRVPSILQFEAVECGAASLAMVLAYFGAWLPLEQLRAACGVTRDGSKASNLLKAARSLGLNAKGYKKEPENIKELPWPLIVHWNFNHYVVLEGLTKKWAYINDPSSGPRRIPAAEFSDAFTGVALAFEKTERFAKTVRPPGLMAAARDRIGASAAAVILIALLSVAIIVPGVVLPVFAKLFVDGIVLKQQEDWVMPLFLAFGLTALVRALLTLLRQNLLLRLEAKLAVVGASRFIWHVLHLPMGFFMQRSPGEIATRVDASSRVAKVFSGELANTIIDCGTVAAFGAIMIGYDPVLGLAAVGLAVPNIFVLRHIREALGQNSKRQSAEMGKLGSATAGLITNIETIKASGLENASFAQWAGRHAKTLEASRELGLFANIVNLGPTLLNGLIQVAVLGLGAYRVFLGIITIGDLVAFQSLATSFAEPLKRIVQLSTTLNAARADLHRVDDALHNVPDPMVAAAPAAAETIAPRQVRGEVTVKNLSYGYNPLDAPLLDIIDLKLAPGERVALVGRSGCSKSTLGRLLCGLLTPRGGEILIDDMALKDMTQRQRAANIAYVDQDIFLFEGTVRDNLTLWNRDIPDAVLTQALDDAAMLDDIVARPGELDAFVDEGGRNFSGGQRQRLEIARALVGNPSVLILDEATAALDPQTEKIIDDNLRRRGCTCIIIAHRLSTVRDCSEIVVMRQGRIVERGTHDELIALRGEYATLIESV